jgi:hypothetical protein
MIKDTLDALIEGHIKIWDPESGEIFVNKRNAVNFLLLLLTCWLVILRRVFT